MSPEAPLNPSDILAALGVTSVGAIAPVQGGSDTAIWRVEHGGQVSALRVFRAEQAAVAQRELEAIELAAAAHIPVPAVRAAGSWRDRPALLLAWSPGAPLFQALQRQPWRVLALGRAFGRTQALIHRIGPRAGWRHLQANWIEWAGDDPPLRAGLERRAGSPALLHLDYHPLNILVDGSGVTAVLDWANSRIGDPRADVARTYTILTLMPFAAGRQPLVLALARRLLAWSWRRGYEELAGRLQDMDWFYAWAGAVMVRDLAPRVGSPQAWWGQRDLARIGAWAGAWRARAGAQDRAQQSD